MEEVDLLRVQLDAARKDAEAQRKRAAAIEVRGRCCCERSLLLPGREGMHVRAVQAMGWEGGGDSAPPPPLRWAAMFEANA